MTVPITDPSSYLAYLPAILSHAGNGAALGQFLKVFEKVLTGIDDGVPLLRPGSGIRDRAVEEQIDRIPLTFDPWQTPPALLDWLAARVGLTFRPEWDEYQRRKLTGQIVGIYHDRGLKRGLHRYLDLYAASGLRPRVVIDDGEALLRVWPNGTQVDTTPVSFARQWPTKEGAPPLPYLIHPLAVTFDASDANGRRGIVVTDANGLDNPSNSLTARRGNVWRLSPNGEAVDWQSPTGESVRPQPVNAADPNDDPLRYPVGVAVADTGDIFVLDRRFGAGTPSSAAVFRYTRNNAGGYSRTNLLNPMQLADFNAAVTYPLDMIAVDGRLIVLDRGKKFDQFAAPKLVVLPTAVGDTSKVKVFPLKAPAVDPRTIQRVDGNSFVLLDCRGQGFPGEAPGALAADLLTVTVDPAGVATDLVPTSLLSSVPFAQNPLRQPLGVVREASGAFLISDAGLKDEVRPAHYDRAAIELPGIYRVEINSSGPRITRLSLRGNLAYPTRLIRDPATGATYLLDFGENARQQKQEFRGVSHSFGVVLYLDQSAAGNARLTDADRDAIYRGIQSIVSSEAPAHTAPLVSLGGVTRL